MHKTTLPKQPNHNDTNNKNPKSRIQKMDGKNIPERRIKCIATGISHCTVYMVEVRSKL